MGTADRDSDTDSGPGAIRALEERALTAWPALQTAYLDGWVVRLAAGYTRRANSVQPLYPGRGDLAAKIAACEAIYTAHGQDTVFKLTAVAEPAGIDVALAAAGYTAEAATSVQTMRLAPGPPPAGAPPRIAAALTESWLDAFCGLNGVAPQHRATMAAMLGRLVPPAAFATLDQNGTPVAAGLAVVDGAYAGLFDIVTATPLRNRGLGRHLVAHLLAWGQARGARHAYLQVMLTNAPARHLYARLGFQEVYQYWYRVRQAPPGGGPRLADPAA